MAEQVFARLLLDAEESAKACGVSRSKWWSMHSAGHVPLPVRLGHRTLWRASELAEWVSAGCPSRDRWEAIREGNR